MRFAASREHFTDSPATPTRAMDAVLATGCGAFRLPDAPVVKNPLEPSTQPMRKIDPSLIARISRRAWICYLRRPAGPLKELQPWLGVRGQAAAMRGDLSGSKGDGSLCPVDRALQETACGFPRRLHLPSRAGRQSRHVSQPLSGASELAALTCRRAGVLRRRGSFRHSSMESRPR